MRVRKNVRAVLTVAGATAIAWGSMFGLSPASAEDAPVEDQVEETTTTTSTTVAPATTTTSTSTTTTSAPTPTTVPGPTGDPDNDGVVNEPAEDVFDTGVTVDRDPTIAFVDVSEDDGVIVALDVAEGAPQRLRNVKWSATRSVGNVALPNGFVSFEVINASGPVDVLTLWPERDKKARSLFKGTASNMKAFTVKDADFADGGLAFVHTIQDGGAGDTDGAVNGTIVDPVGPGYLTAAATTSTTARRGATTLARTGNDMSAPALGGVAAIVAGAALLAIAWKPQGAHYNFNR